jgi:hypothetical protein
MLAFYGRLSHLMVIVDLEVLLRILQYHVKGCGTDKLKLLSVTYLPIPMQVSLGFDVTSHIADPHMPQLLQFNCVMMTTSRCCTEQEQNFRLCAAPPHLILTSGRGDLCYNSSH